jgi:ppGpp synthetase/RelA/SpoT-type nucleotidyltranferase
MKPSNAKIDKAGLTLTRDIVDVDEYIDLEHVFDEYRKGHLLPLTETTLELQHWLSSYGSSYYIAQRLKRKPQIIRKLKRLSVRLTQLQDIGGCRIIVETNKDVDKLLTYIREKLAYQTSIKLLRETDYRDRGRDDTGYRALHLILNRSGYKLELQIRSRIQHYWAESIERTSVVYGHHLKEKEGDQIVIQYFKTLSDIFAEIEAKREPSPIKKLEMDRLRRDSERIIQHSDHNRVLDSHVDENIIKTLTEIESKKGSGFNNWIIIFNWNIGSFIYWDIVDRDPDAAIKAYVENERTFPAQDGYEVVLIGSSDVKTVRQTHSHYFGIDSYENILDSLDKSVEGFSRRLDLDTDARQILLCLRRRNYWGKKSVALSTLKNHYCNNIAGFDASLELLLQKQLILMPHKDGPVSLNLKEKQQIDRYVE